MSLRRRVRRLLGQGPVFLAAKRCYVGWTRWRRGLRDVHPTAYVQASAVVRPDLKADEYAYVGPECIVGPKVRIGRYTMLAPRVMIVGADHRMDVPGVPMIFAGRPDLPETVIEDDAWIGASTIVMAGVRIGRGAIVAAGSVVTRDVAAYEIHAGIPARRLRDRFEDEGMRAAHDRMLDGPVVEANFAERR